MIDILSQDIPSALIAALLLISTTVLLIMGVQSLLAGVRKAKTPRKSFDSLYVRIGLMYLIDTFVYALTSVRLLLGSGVIDLWVGALLSLVIIAPVLVFDALAREAADKEALAAKAEALAVEAVGLAEVAEMHRIEREKGCDCD